MQVAVWKATTIVLQTIPRDWDAFSFKNFMELSLSAKNSPCVMMVMKKGRAGSCG